MDQNPFNAALTQARKTPPLDGGVWTHLLATLRMSEPQLTETLRQRHGIVCLSDPQWSKIRILDHDAQPGPSAQSLPGCVAIVVSDGQRVALFEDPWSPEAVRAMGHTDWAGVKTGLARPGQTADLVSMLARTPSPSIPSNSPVLNASPTLQTESVASVSDDSPVVQFVDNAIAHAYTEGASDIHFETNRQGMGIKYRLDGVMAAGPRLEGVQRAEEVISRIKVMAQLDITERRRPQDGRIHWQRSNAMSIDLRVSIMPSIFGEDAVLRLLDKAQLRQSQKTMSLDVLGFEPSLSARLRDLASRPHGMLLITGPTGSGKTTTVYAALSEVNDGLEKIVTIEDPVEYELPGVLQIPVNEQKGLTFATGLRSILRHDPDKILVGEIRDSETAEIAVQSSLTGHLVFTTVHANSLFDVLGRFQHFGIEPFALASALNGVVVQRLLRKLCPHCASKRATTDLERKQLLALQIEAPEYVPLAVGCSQCRSSGYRGRFVVAEVHTLDDVLRDMIVRRTSMSELKNKVYTNPNERLIAQAFARVALGQTTIEEVIRVVGLV